MSIQFTPALRAGVWLSLLCGLACITGCKDQMDAWKKYFSKGTNNPSSQASHSSTSVAREPTLQDITNTSAFDALHNKITLSSLLAVPEVPPAFSWPAGTDDDFRICMGRFLDAPKLDTTFSYPVDKEMNRLSADMSRDCKRLYVIDADNMVRVIDTDSGEKTHEFESPLEGAYAILVDVSGEYVYLANYSTLVRVNIEDQAVDGLISGILTNLLDWHRALDTNAIAAVNDYQIMYINENFERVELLPNISTSSQRVAIHPEGKYLASCTNNELLRWHVNETPYRTETLKGDFFSYHFNPVTCDYDADRWFNTYAMHEYAGEKHSNFQDSNGEAVPFIINPQVSDAISCSLGEDSWSTMVGTINDGTLNPPLVIANMRWYPTKRPQFSPPVLIDALEVKRIWGNRRGDRVGLFTESDIRICDRNIFDDPYGDMMATSLVKRIYTNQISQIEAAANFLRSRNWPEKCQSGEDLYNLVIEFIAREWERIENNPDEKDAAIGLAALEAWKASGSEIAIAASAFRHIQMGADARGSDWANHVEPKGLAELKRRIDLANKDLDKLLARSMPPAEAYRMRIQTLMYSGAQFSEGMKVAGQCMALYPEYLGVHAQMNYWLLPRWGGLKGAVHVYTDMIASLFPAALQDQVYTLLGIDLLDSSSSYEMDDTNIDLVRMTKTAKLMLSQNQLTRRQVECFIRVPAGLDDMATANDFAHYHLTHFVTPTPAGHRSRVFGILTHLKFDNMNATDKLRAEASD